MEELKGTGEAGGWAGGSWQLGSPSLGPGVHMPYSNWAREIAGFPKAMVAPQIPQNWQRGSWGCAGWGWGCVLGISGCPTPLPSDEGLGWLSEIDTKVYVLSLGFLFVNPSLWKQNDATLFFQVFADAWSFQSS